MTKITSINELIEHFNNANPSEQIGILKSIDVPTIEFEKFATWKDDDYTRNCLIRTEEFEFILLCWDRGSATPIHGHDGQDCWVYQVSGDLKETRFEQVSERFDISSEIELCEGKIAYMHDRMGYHKIENLSSQRAMSLHIYSNPIDRCKVYNEELSKFEIKKMEYDSVGDEAFVKIP